MTTGGDNITRGIFMIIAATFIFACQDAVTKHLAQTYAMPQIIWVRFLFFAVFAIILSSWERPLKEAVRARRPWLQILRSLLIVGEIAIFVLAVKNLSLSETHALFASFPLMVTALSAVFLGEKVGLRRWSAVIVGFLGVLVILRPGTGVFQIESLIAIAAAAMFAIYQLITRITSQDDGANTSLLYMAIVGAAILSFAGPFFWLEPTPEAWGFLILLSALGAVGHLLLILALQNAPTSTLQPFNFTTLVWATLVGYIVFENLPDLWTIIGACIVVGSGLYTILRERVRKIPPPLPKPNSNHKDQNHDRHSHPFH